jgi:hypothetical protein
MHSIRHTSGVLFASLLLALGASSQAVAAEPDEDEADIAQTEDELVVEEENVGTAEDELLGIPGACGFGVGLGVGVGRVGCGVGIGAGYGLGYGIGAGYGLGYGYGVGYGLGYGRGLGWGLGW